MKDNINVILKNMLSHSTLIKSVKALKQAPGQSRLFTDALRALTKKEIELLEAKGSSSPDWKKIKAATGFKPDFIRNSAFIGECVLGVFEGIDRELEPGLVCASGIYNSTVIHSEIGNNCLIKECGILANYIVKENVVIACTNSISSTANSTFGNGIKIPVGMETGGREVISFAELDVLLAERVAQERQDGNLLKSYEDFIRQYLDSISFDFGIIESGSVIRNTATIKNTYIGPSALIDGASLIENCTILSSPEEQTDVSHGAIVKNSCIQWGCQVTSMAIVADSVLTEHSHVERHGKVTASIIGPNTGIAEGEATSCLIGPFVGFHHQALLIAALWPQGKGNIGYGANVGSNHTSRAPDQEIFCGEGMFFGLGVNIKFPSNFTGAPYSIIATGVTTLPQKVEFPFSLIMSPSRQFPDIPPSFNEIIPAWVLSDNIYTLRRNEAKYKKRNQAKRTHFEFTVFRPEIVDMMVEARDRLSNIETKKSVYTEKDLPGLGKNFVQEEKYLQAIDAYNFYIEYYCFSGLKDRIAHLIDSKKQSDLSSVYTQKTDSPLWEHQRELLADENYTNISPKENLTRLIDILEKIAQDTFKAKSKDDARGKKIIPDYDEVYVKATDDSFIKTTRQETDEAVKRIKKLIDLL